jgi:hypothetical protein
MEPPFQIKTSPGDRDRGRLNQQQNPVLDPASGRAPPGQPKNKERKIESETPNQNETNL